MIWIHVIKHHTGFQLHWLRREKVFLLYKLLISNSRYTKRNVRMSFVTRIISLTLISVLISKNFNNGWTKTVILKMRKLWILSMKGSSPLKLPVQISYMILEDTPTWRATSLLRNQRRTRSRKKRKRRSCPSTRNRKLPRSPKKIRARQDYLNKVARMKVLFHLEQNLLEPSKTGEERGPRILSLPLILARREIQTINLRLRMRSKHSSLIRIKKRSKKKAAWGIFTPKW